MVKTRHVFLYNNLSIVSSVALPELAPKITIPPHFLLVALPNRGAMNLALQLAERLTRIGN